MSQPPNRLPPIVENAIQQRLAAEARRLEVVTPMMQNIQVGQNIAQPINPLNETLANNRDIAEEQRNLRFMRRITRANRVAYVVNPVQDDGDYDASVAYAYIRPPRPPPAPLPPTPPPTREPSRRENSSRLLESRRLFEDQPAPPPPPRNPLVRAFRSLRRNDRPQPPSGQSTNPRSRMSRQQNPPQ